MYYEGSEAQSFDRDDGDSRDWLKNEPQEVKVMDELYGVHHLRHLDR